jgi:hypothetical protein
VNMRLRSGVWRWAQDFRWRWRGTARSSCIVGQLS